jgi:hypothetical protein
VSRTFLPWLRPGLAGQITLRDNAAGLTNRATVPLAIELNNQPVRVTAVQLLGPGDVKGIDYGQVLRTDPPDLTGAHETTCCPLIEFASPVLPWLFSPAAPTDGGRLRPWLTLAVVRDRDGVTLTPNADHTGTILHIEGPAGDELPNLDDVWATAHVQIAGEARPADLPALLARNPERLVSRLLCLRPLATATTYRAVVVPTFAAGRAAGLGESLKPGDSLQPAWRQPDTGVTLPVYYTWQFTTAEEGGDFATLAQLLQPQPCPDGVGALPLDITHAGIALPTGTGPLVLRGPLQQPPRSGDPPDPPVPDQVRVQLAAFASTPEAATTRLGLPLYGAAYAARDTVSVDDGGWFAELNLDPRLRVIAALGGRLVATQQEALVAAAWRQAGQVREVNQLLDRAGLARSTATATQANHLGPLPADVRLQLAAPARSRVLISALTIEGTVAAAPVPDALLSPTFRRITRPRGPLLRRLSAAANRARPVSTTDTSPLGLVTSARAAGLVETTARSDLTAAVKAAAAHNSAAGRALALTGLLTEAFATATAPADASDPRHPDQADSRTLAADQASGPGLTADRLGAVVLQRLNPETTVPARILPLVRRPASSTTGVLADPLAATTLAPRFPTPMFPALAETAAEFMLPGAQRIPANAVTTLEINPRFVAAFLVGLNHELARELIWRDYPVDRRATYFRRFWDYRGQASGTAPDIDEIAGWDPGAPLAAAGHDAGSDEHLVLALRGDLLRRYPRTAVTAVRAADPAGTALADETTPGNVLEPTFTGFLPPDLRLFGFPLSEARARTQDGTGWFFVLQEQATEARFRNNTTAPVPLTGTAADVARTALRLPVRVAMHARQLLPS